MQRNARLVLPIALALVIAAIPTMPGIAAAASTDSPPVTALMDVATDAAIVASPDASPSLAQWNPYFCPGEAYRAVYTRRMTVRRGDILWLHAEVETTNDLRDPADNWKTALLQMRIVVEPPQPAQPSATLAEAGEGTYPRALHHVPLTAAAVYRAQGDGVVEVRAEFRASVAGAAMCRTDKRDFVFLNQKYGGIHIARFRPFADAASAAKGHGFALTDVRRSTQPAAADYGRCIMAGEEMAAPYSITVPLDVGDLLLVLGQTGVQLYSQPPSIAACGAGNRFELKPPVSPEGCRSDAPGGQAMAGTVPDDLHGVRLRASPSRIDTFTASENISRCLPQSTLFTHAVVRPDTRGESTIATAVNGLTGYGRTIIPGTGQIVGLRFSPIEGSAPAGLFVADAEQVAAPAAAAKRAEAADPQAWSLLASRPVQLAGNAQLWASASSELEHPHGVRENLCRSALLLRDEHGEIAAQSPDMLRASTPDTTMLPLQNEAVFPIAKPGRYVIEMRAACAAADARATMTRLGYVHFAPASAPR